VEVILQVGYSVIRLDEFVVELCHLGDEILDLGSERRYHQLLGILVETCTSRRLPLAADFRNWGRRTRRGMVV
jgi:hypothetical protein